MPAPVKQPVAILSDPVVNGFSTVNDLGSLGPLTDFKLTRIEHDKHFASVTPENFAEMLAQAKPVPPDYRFDAWHYADSSCGATFTARERKWSAALLLGGLGFIHDDNGRKGAFWYDPSIATGKKPSDERASP